MTIKILKSAIPYSTDITIAGITFQFDFKYNSFDERVYIDLYDVEGNLIYANEPIMFGIPLWYNKLVDEYGNFNKKFPQKYIIPNTLDRTVEKITFLNIDKVELIVRG